MNKMRTYLKSTMIILFVGFVSAAFANQPVKHEFPPLPYAYNALEPYIDAATMELHYSKHHKGYYDRFIQALDGTEWSNKSLDEIFANISKTNASFRNQGGGYYNHVIFWENMTPDKTEPSKELTAALIARFGSVDVFKEEFNKAATSVFGSGWAWLVLTSDNKLEIVTTANQDNPLMDVVSIKGKPLLALDVWEHAYYLKYQNRRAEYIKSFWNVVNWNAVSKRFAGK
jgi:superoxide dismutase, Fe-Mn family